MKLLKVKWENILVIFLFIFTWSLNIKAFMIDGFDFSIFGCELFLNSMLLIVFNYIFKIVRKELLKSMKG